MGERLFTLEEANALIPRLEILMGRLQQLTARLRDGVAALTLESESPSEQVTVEALVEARPELRETLAEMRKIMGDIGACGGELKGIELGLVDFPAEMNGEVILLCWQFGEKEIEYFHTRTSGFEGRKALDPERQSRRPLQ